MRNTRFLTLFAYLVPSLIVTGCGSIGTTLTPSVTPVAGTTKVSITGTIHGGQQPVAGAAVQLYAAGAPLAGGGYGVGSTPLIPAGQYFLGGLPGCIASGGQVCYNGVVSDANGNFSITGDYTLPTVASSYYLVATGGSPAPGMPTNPSITMMTVLQGCTPTTTLSSSLVTNIDELTTMAAVIGLQKYMAPPSLLNNGIPTIGAPSTDIVGLRNGFATAMNLVNINTGVSLKAINNYATTDLNALTLNTLGDVLAYCVNSATAGGQCATLSLNATPSGSFAALDTVQDAYYMATLPTNNVGGLYNLASQTPPFVGLTSQPSNFSTPVLTSLSACQATVNLGNAGNYAVLAYAGITNSSTASDKTAISGSNDNIGSYPTPTETGFTGGTYVANIDNTDAQTAKADLSTAFTDAAGRTSPAVLPLDLSNLTFTPGLYSTSSTVTLNSGSVTLDAQNDPNAVFVFQIGSTFTAAGGTQVLLVNGASAKNVFWQVGSSATINGAAAWQGNIMAYASVSFGTDASLVGRALAENGSVTLLSNKITVP
jgi:hypothetical protein